MFRKTWSALALLTVLVALIIAWAASVTHFSFNLAAREQHDSFSASTLLPESSGAVSVAAHCAGALAQGAVCVAANKRALEIMSANHLEAFTVVQDVRTGALVAFAASEPSKKETEWADTLSIGEANMMVTGLHLSRFLQAVGNGGMMLSPVAREEQPAPSSRNLPQSRRQAGRNPIRVLQPGTALRLQSAMRDTVARGTAKSIAETLKDTGWQIGGKTGTGPGPAPIGPQSDGWFAGLIFDPQGQARFTVATFVRHGGTGGGNAAKISAELARYIIGESITVSR